MEPISADKTHQETGVRFVSVAVVSKYSSLTMPQPDRECHLFWRSLCLICGGVVTEGLAIAWDNTLSSKVLVNNDSRPPKVPKHLI